MNMAHSPYFNYFLQKIRIYTALVWCMFVLVHMLKRIYKYENNFGWLRARGERERRLDCEYCSFYHIYLDICASLFIRALETYQARIKVLSEIMTIHAVRRVNNNFGTELNLKLNNNLICVKLGLRITRLGLYIYGVKGQLIVRLKTNCYQPLYGLVKLGTFTF